jgi:hypothetical protein
LPCKSSSSQTQARLRGISLNKISLSKISLNRISNLISLKIKDRRKTKAPSPTRLPKVRHGRTLPP